MAVSKVDKWLEPQGLEVIRQFARNGDTHAIIAKNMGICGKTLANWIRQHPQICNALKDGKAPVDASVERSLLNSALGYYCEEETREALRHFDGTVMLDDNEDPILKVTKITKKWIPPVVAAQFGWLKRRVPSKWGDENLIGMSEDEIKNIGNSVTALIDVIKAPQPNRELPVGDE